jgi:hypothetical protein
MTPLSRMAVAAAITLAVGGCAAPSRTEATGHLPTPTATRSGASHYVPPEIGPGCQPNQLLLTLAWHQDSTGSLSGNLVASNPGSHACGLLLKPSLQPLGLHGKPLNTTFLITAEERYGPNALRPGHSAHSGVSWAGWCGKPAGPDVVISFGGGKATIAVTGPHQPTCPPTKTDPTNISSDWFEGLLSGA